MVFGAISDSNSMANVKMIEKSGTYVGPNADAAYIPARVAPAVCATVFKIRIEEIGSAIFFFISMNLSARATLIPAALEASSAPVRVEKSAASNNEHILDTDRVITTTNISDVI
jgi:hypothetical protein